MKHFLLLSLSIATSLFLLDFDGLATVFKTGRRLAGFSPDGLHYIYLESYRNSVTEVPTAQIQIVNVPTNACVKNGCLQTDYDRSNSNLSTKAAEDELLQRTSPIRQELKLTQLKVGIQLPITSRTMNPDGSETVEVRLNNQTEAEPLKIRLEQKYIPPVSPGGVSGVERASMRLVINYDYRQLTLGDLSNYREAVKKYSIREVRLSPNKRNIVVLIDKLQPTYEGVLQTTFVQSFPIPGT